MAREFVAGTKTFDCLLVSYDEWKQDFEQTIAKVAEFLELSPKSNLRNMVMSRPETFLDKVLRKTKLSGRTQIYFRSGKIWWLEGPFRRSYVGLGAQIGWTTSRQVVSDIE